jgi:hypothetical protein
MTRNRWPQKHPGEFKNAVIQYAGGFALMAFLYALAVILFQSPTP